MYSTTNNVVSPVGLVLSVELFYSLLVASSRRGDGQNNNKAKRGEERDRRQAFQSGKKLQSLGLENMECLLSRLHENDQEMRAYILAVFGGVTISKSLLVMT